MRVLEVVHYFLPRHSAGTEVYTASVARGLRERGHDVSLFFTEKILSERDGTVLRRDHEGIPCRVLVNNLTYRGFEGTFRHPPAERAFAAALEEFAPDVVHFQHLMLLSLGLPRIAAARGVPSVMSLHDFWLACARFGQLLERGEHLCEGPRPERCAVCIQDFKFAQSSVERTVIDWIRRTKEVSGFDLAPLVEAWRRSRVAASGVLRPGFAARRRGGREAPSPTLVRGFEMRAREVADLLRHVDRFLTPSATVRDRMVRYGLPPDRVEVLPLGIAPFEVPERPRLEQRGPVFGFVGTLAPHKGAHVLVEAARRLEGRARVEIYGREDAHPRYAASLRQAARDLPIRFHGPVDHARIGRVFGSFDVLVVPSVWFEAFGLTVRESWFAGLPVVASRLGGLEEAIEDGVNGLLFDPGDADSLAERLAELIDDPGRVARLAAGVERPISLDEHVREVEARLLAAVHDGRAGAAP